MEPTKKYTPRLRRDRKTKASVWIGEILSRYIITAGGVGTIAAVIAVCVFLVWVAAPLFYSASVEQENRANLDWSKSPPVQIGLDEDQLMCWVLFGDGSLQLVRLDTGELLSKQTLFKEKRLTAISFTGGEESVFGFADGSVQMGKIAFTTTFVEPEKLPTEVAHLATAKEGSARYKDGMVMKTAQKQYRFQELSVELKKPAEAPFSAPVLLIDQSKTTTGQVVVALTGNGKLRLNNIKEKENLGTGEITYVLSGIELPYSEPIGKGPPLRLCTSAEGDQIYLFWQDGHLVRIDARDKERPVVAETINVLADATLQITDVRSLIGKGTLLVGDTSGRLRAWFYTPTADGGKMVCGHDLPATGSSVVGIAVSDRSRLTAVAHENGKVRLIYVTSERVMAEFDLAKERPTNLILAPKDDGLAVSSAKGIWQWSFDKRHPEVTLKALFSPVWYESYPQPEYVWQSSGGTTGFEPKFSFIPLVFGTVKASFYSLLFGVPLALLAAIYTSEFLNPRTKAVVKPAIELMASLPSVVLGFLAGLVFVQFVESVIPAVLACMLTMPLSFMAGACIWQLAPDRVTQILSRWRFAFICLVVPVGLLAAIPVGEFLQWSLFGGDLRAWLTVRPENVLGGRDGSAVGGWFLLLLPFSLLSTFILMHYFINPVVRTMALGKCRFTVAWIDIGRLLVGGIITLTIAWLSALVLDQFGLDPRGPFVGPYSQRNALVVGFTMGFAIIPIVFTIAEDALSSVPEHLRAGSLAAGATRWQTGVRIVIPTAMSGLFSAVMIGLGRAVGETMIVLMATGNTPVMDWNIFNGFRTLSANIAVELPEAVQGSTHYRTLFLAALTLFAITFVLNTLAEVVRSRFRKRAYQL